MKKDLSHLPEYKQIEIKEITNLAIKLIRPELIILYGSYARDDHVEIDITHTNELTEVFQSDIDILVIFENKIVEKQRYKYINQAQNDLKQRLNTKRIQSPISLEWNNMPEVNKMISERNPFMRDIVKQGIELYSSGRYKLTREAKMNKKEMSYLANQYFERWFERAKVSFENYEFNFSKRRKEYNNEATFNLHQTTERAFRAILYTYTFYYPKTHNIEKLYDSVKQFDKQLEEVFLRKTEEERRLFNLLKDSYVDARYSPTFEITKDELRQIAKQVKNLLETTEKLCLQRISEYE